MVTDRAEALPEDDAVRPLGAGVIGLAMSAAREFPLLTVSTVDVDLDATAPADLAARIDAEGGRRIALRGRARLERRLDPVALPDAGTSPVRAGATYIVLGGTGGLGNATAAHLAAAGAGHLVLVGRRDANDAMRQAFSALEAKGARVTHIAVGAAQPGALARALADRAVGPIHGAVVATLALRDGALARMSEEAMETVLAAKAAATQELARALRGEPLDFLLVHGSAQSYAGTAGQANYAAGATAQDAFVAALARATGWRVTTIHWGFWGEVGAVATSAHHARLAAAGIAPIATGEGVAAMARILAAGVPQAVAIRASDAVLAGLGADPAATAERAPGRAPPLVPAPAPAPRDVASIAAADAGLSAWEAWGAARVADIFAEHLAGAPTGADGLAARLAVAPGQRRVFDGLLDLLVARGVLIEGAQGLTRSATPTPPRPALAPAHGRLIEAATDGLPAILSGRRPAADVLFPDGSTRLVEPVYTADALMRHVQGATAAVVVGAVERALAAADAPDRIAILEVGAGTGATTAALVEALAPFADRLDYLYTDLSPALVAHGRERFGAHPFMRFRPLDITAAPGDAGVADIVVAANVLHATPRIDATLGHVRRLLRPGGLLAALEAVAARDFASLTFGLTPGWWAFSDPEARLAGSPLLGIAEWRRALAAAGFADVSCDPLGLPGRGHALMLARSDGSLVRTSRSPGAAPTVAAEPAPVRPAGDVVRWLAGEIAAVLDLPADRLDPARPLDAYGVNSLMIPRVTLRLERALGVRVPAAALFEHPTLAALAAHLAAAFPDAVASCLGGAVAPGPPEEPEDDPLRHFVENLSDEEVAAMLAELDGGGRMTRPPLSPDREALLRRLRTQPRRDVAEPVAIIGLGLYAPGPGAAGVRHQAGETFAEGHGALDAFWRNLATGHDAVGEIPADRWDWRDPAFFDADKARAVATGRSYSRWGGFLEGGVDRFDALFFGISPREAETMDPQERLFLQVAWHAVEDAGLARATLAGRAVGVFAAAMFGHYQLVESPAGVANSSFASIANRVSHLFDWRGPSLAVDTMCSSSLAAIALACTSLRRGESAMALAGGVNLITHPRRYLLLSQGRYAASDGRCRAFGAGGDGYVPGEGAGAVLLKPLRTALADGDPIRGVIRGIGTNHGGRTAGSFYTVPSPLAQGEAIAAALAEARVAPGSVGYVEAHGTGTALGDPVELAGLVRGYGDARARPQIALGSVKSNVGHLEGAAGIVGLAKVLLSFRHGRLAPSLPHSETLNPECDFAAAGFALQLEPGAWPERDGPRRAGLSAFGAGGTNVHMILEEPPTVAARPALTGGRVPVVLSAPGESQLRASAAALAEALAADPRIALADVAHTLAVGREPMTERLALTAASTGELSERLAAFANGDTGGILRGRAGTPPERPVPADPESAARHFVAGGNAAPVAGGRRIALPGIAFARERYWLEPASSRAAPARLHPLIDANVSSVDGIAFRRRFRADEALMRDHRFAGTPMLPGAATLEMARAAAALALPSGTVSALANVVWLAPVVAADDGAVDLRVALTPAPGGLAFEVISGAGTHARGTARTGATLLAERLDPAAIAARCGPPTPAADGYATLARHGLEYGASLRVLTRIAAGTDEVLAELDLTATDPACRLEPAAIDGALQALVALPLLGRDGPALPFSVDEVAWTAAPATGAPMPARLLVHARKVAGRAAADILIADQDGAVLVRLSGFAVVPVPQRAAAPLAAPTPAAAATAAQSGGRAEPLVARLTALLAHELRLPAHRIDPAEDFERYGLQSIQVMDMTAALENEFGTLPKTLFFEYRTLETLAGYFLAEHAETVAARYASAPPQTAPASAGPENASPERLAAPSIGRAAETAPASAIAILGIAGRYPGAPDLATFWDNLSAGRDAIGDIPADRWDPDDLPATADGKPLSRRGGFLADADRFDARFFRIAPREAALIDPQERLFLETVWQALEDAALTRTALGQMRVGVYAGVMHGLYQLHGPALTAAGRPAAPGSAYWSIANRVSAFCDFRGPSMAVDTACSASLSAIHLACQALRAGEADVAVAGGVNIASHQQKYLQLAEMNFASSDGRCRAFGAGGDGYVPGEGVGAVVLKPLAAALDAGDPVRAVIRGGALNHGGTTNGYTVPSPQAQAGAIVDALARAGLSPDDIDIVEAHGTGTALGDPIEIRALNRAFAGRSDPRPVPIGSVKSNIGHLESAAGVAGLTKVVLQLGRRTLAPSLHADPPNPDVDFAGGPFEVCRQLAPWPVPPGGRPRRAGLSSFGAGGSNAHLVIEEAPARAHPADDGTPQIAPLSARGPEALTARVADLLEHLRGEGADASLAGIAATLQHGREAMADRLALVVTSRAELVASLAGILDGAAVPGLYRAGSVPLPEEPGARRALAARLLAEGDPDAIASHFAAGLDFAWPASHHGQRLNLPPYRFAGGRHWLPVRPVDRVAVPADAPSPPLAAPPTAARSAPAQGGTVVCATPVWRPAVVHGSLSAAPLLVVTADTRLAAALQAAHPGPFRHLSPGESWESDPAADAEALVWHVGPGERAEDAFGRLLALLRSLARRSAKSLDLLCVHPDAPGGTFLAGLLRTAMQEIPGLAPRLLALPAGAEAVDHVAAVRAALAPGHPSGSELRPGADGLQRRGWQLLGEVPAAPLPRGPWLVTGGAGGVGLATARALAEPGMAFMLLGRAAPSARTDAAVAALRAAGAEAMYRATDVADAEALAGALAEMRVTLGPPVAVFHAAGVIRDALLRNKQEADVAAVLSAKVAGVEALDRATRHDPLELFALCSSLAAVTGNPGQGDYAAANRYLDAFAEARQGPGRSLSVCWPYWREGGMRLGAAAEAAMGRLGLVPLETASAVDALRRAAGSGHRVVAVAAGDPDAIATLIGAEPAAPAEPVAPASKAVADARTLMPRLAALVGEVLGVAPEEVEPDESFLEYGFDSVSLATLAARVAATFAIDLPPARLFEMPSLSALAGHLAPLVPSGEPLSAPPPVTARAYPAPTVVSEAMPVAFATEPNPAPPRTPTPSAACRWPSSAWPRSCRVRPTSAPSGGPSAMAATSCATCPPTDGTGARSTAIPRWNPAAVASTVPASSTGWTGSTRSSSASRPTRRSGWIRSSASSCKPCGTRWKMPRSSPPASRGGTSRCSSASRARSTTSSSATRGSRSVRSPAPGWRTRSSPTASPTFSG